MAASNVNMSNDINSNGNLVDDFEEAFQGIVNCFIKEDGLSHIQDNKDELKADAEQNIVKFIEVAKQLETFFLQRRLQLSVLKPEQIVKEDCNELKLEIARKDELIKKHYDKIAIWQSMLADLPGGGGNNMQQAGNDLPQPPIQHPQQQQQLPQQQPMMPAAMQPPYPNR